MKKKGGGQIKESKIIFINNHRNYGKILNIERVMQQIRRYLLTHHNKIHGEDR